MFLEIRDLALFVRLGWEEAERSIAQEVRISIRLIFSEVPKAEQTDELSDTVCYQDLCAKIQSAVKQPSFKTIEHLYAFLENRILHDLAPGMRFILRVRKVNPPVPGLLGGIEYGSIEALGG